MKYSYYAKKISGEEIKGEMEARDRFELAKNLRQKEYTLVSAEEIKTKKIILSEISFGGVSIADKMIFSRNLAVMISAGVSLTKALDILVRQTKNQKFKKTLTNLAESIRKGNSLSDSMKEYPKIFTSIFVAMVKVGEESGKLSDSLLLVSNQLERDNNLRKKVKGAMMYPMIIIVAMIVIGILMLIYVVPTLISTFKEMGVALPLSTRIVIGLSNFFINQTILFIFSVFALFGVVGWGAKTKKGKKLFNAILLKLPIFSTLTKKINSARTTRTLASLISSGVDVLEALAITKDVLQNDYYKEILDEARDDIQEGVPMSQSFKKAEHLYPILVGEMMAIGEETGKLSEMLVRLADFYEEEVNDTTKNMTTIIEPILMVLIGAFVGFFAISMIKPMYSMMGGI